jgi:hydroxyethylthiazole kinase-like uncharacterized protein yjeF
MQTINQNTLPARLPARAEDSNKGDYGSVGIVGGAPGMAGAVLLAGRAALHCGAGRVYVGALDERLAVDPACPELMIVAAENLPAFSGERSCLVVGPGLGDSSRAHHLLEASLPADHALLLDADALNWLARDHTLLPRLRDRCAPTLITPHPGEAARLLEQDTQSVQADRAMTIQRLSTLTGATVVLKGAGSLVLQPGSEIWCNSSGNPGMAAPGMGDVLAGIIAALLVQGLSAEQAAVLGVWLHGQAGDEAVAAGCGPAGLTASEVSLRARQILNRTGSGLEL